MIETVAKSIEKLKNDLKKKQVDYTVMYSYDNSFDFILDFSEHDKVFEDKIAELEKQTESLMREKQLAYYRSEQLMKTADILNSANKELKQRIAELESKETKKPKNGWIRVVAKEIKGQEYVRLEDFMRVVNDLQEQNRLEDDWK